MKLNQSESILSVAPPAPHRVSFTHLMASMLLCGLLLGALVLISRYSYPLFHSLAELFSIVIGWSFFTLAWNTRCYMDNDFLLLLGIVALFTSGIDLLHLMAYKGLSLFPGYDANLPTQLWIAGRYFQSIAMLAAVSRMLLPSERRLPLNAYFVLGVCAVITAVLTGVIFGGAFPTCYVEGTGLTPFKKISELIISSILLISMLLLWKGRSRFDRGVLRLLLASIILMTLAGLAFIFYVRVYDFSNLMGHLFKIASFYLLYRATFLTGLKRPYALIFRDLTRTEEMLRTSLEEKEVLLKEIHHRVKNNLAAIMGLLDLEGQTLMDKTARTTLAELGARIQSMALVHEQLYRSENFSRIDFQDYLEALIALLRSSYERSGNIHVGVAATGVVMGLDNAVPCGLLITELVTNAFKYAFPDGLPRSGAGNCEITISAQWDGAAYTLIVADNGVGLPAGMDWMNTKTMGLVLVRMLGRHQLRGQIDLDRDGGTAFRLRFNPRDRGMRE